MELFLMTLVTGFMLGGIYALVALGWTIIYKCSGVLNLAMGELTLIGAYVSYSFYMWTGNFVLSLFLTLLVGIVLGVLTERIFLDKMIGEKVLAVIMVTVGLSFFFKGCVELVFGTDTVVFQPAVFSLQPYIIEVFGNMIIVGRVYLWSFVAAMVLLVVFVGFFQYTRWGLVHAGHGRRRDGRLVPGHLGPVRLLRLLGHRLHGRRGGRLLTRKHQRINISVGHLGLIVLPAVVLGGLNSVPRSHCGRAGHRHPGELLRGLPGPVLPRAGSRRSPPLCSWSSSSCSSPTGCGAGRGSSGSDLCGQTAPV